MSAWLVCVVWWSVQVVTGSSSGRSGVGSVCVCGTVVEGGFGVRGHPVTVLFPYIRLSQDMSIEIRHIFD